MTSHPSFTVGLPASYGSFPLDEYDRVNRQVSHIARNNKSGWHAFASAWNAVCYRASAMESLARQWRRLSADGHPSAMARYELERTLFDWAAAAQSGIECLLFAISTVSKVRAGSFQATRDGDLRFTPTDVAKELQRLWPDAGLSGVVRSIVDAPAFRSVCDWRRVLFHRGSLPRQVNLSVGGVASRSDAMPVNPADPAADWDYALHIGPAMLDAETAWCEGAIKDGILAIHDFVEDWRGPEIS